MTFRITITLFLLNLIFIGSSAQLRRNSTANPDSSSTTTSAPQTDSVSQRNVRSEIFSRLKSYKLPLVKLNTDSVPLNLKNVPQRFRNILLSGLPLNRASMPDMKDWRKQLAPFNTLFSNSIAFNGASASYVMSDNSSWLNSDSRSYYGDFEITSNWSIATVPFEVGFNNQTFNDIVSSNFNNLLVQFKKENYLADLRKKLKGKFNPQDFLNTTLKDQVQAIKTNAESQLRKELDNINQQFGSTLGDQVKQLGDLDGMVSKDMLSVREQLLNKDFVNDVAGKEKLLSELMNRKNTGQPVNGEELKALENQVDRMKGVKALIEKIEEHKNKWQSSGLVNKIRQMELLDKKQLQKIAQDPSIIASMAKQHLNLNGFQKLFLKINQLNIGQNTLTATPLSMRHLMNKGINTELINNNKYFMVGMGKMQTFNSILDRSFEDNLNAGDGTAKMVRIGIGNPSASYTHISVMSYSQSLSPVNLFSSLNEFRNTVVTTISNQVTLGDKRLLMAEFSRSATSYQRPYSRDTGLQNKPAMDRLLSGNDLAKNIAFSLQYEDELIEEGLSYAVYVRKTANGYTNPGNTFLNSGGKELGFNVRKTLLKRKLTASVRSDFREFNYSVYAKNLWRNQYSVMDVQWRLKRGQSVGIRYIPTRMRRVENGASQLMTSLDRLTVNGNIAAKITGKYYRNNLSLSWQKNRYLLDNQSMVNNMLSVASFQTITIENKLLFVSVNYDHAAENMQLVYFNSTLLAETGITYQLFQKFSLSSSLSYNSVREWYKQVGIKQSITGQINDRFNVNIYVDARKNLQLHQPLLFGQFRADISVFYQLQK